MMDDNVNITPGELQETIAITGTLSAQIGELRAEIRSGFDRVERNLKSLEGRIDVLEEWRTRQDERAKVMKEYGLIEDKKSDVEFKKKTVTINAWGMVIGMIGACATVGAVIVSIIR